MHVLLPITNSDEFDLFTGLPLQSLLAQLPRVERSSCSLGILTTQELKRKFEESGVYKRLSDVASIVFDPIDDLVVDTHFSVIQSLAYIKGMNARLKGGGETVFAFVEPNVVLANNALASISRRLSMGADAVEASYLGVERKKYEAMLGALPDAERFSARRMVSCAFESLSVDEFASIVSNNFSFSNFGRRVHYSNDKNAMVTYDYDKALIALRVKRASLDGYVADRNPSFFQDLCPGGNIESFRDSDQFFGARFAGRTSEFPLSVGGDDLKKRARYLKKFITEATRSRALANPVLFHSGTASGTVNQTLKRANSYATSLDRELGRVGGLADAGWIIDLYLWRVRMFELGRGGLPEPPFAKIFRASAVSVEGDAAAGAEEALVEVKTHYSRNRFKKTLRALQRVMFGRAPNVTIAHPEWLEYRTIGAVLRDAKKKQDEKILYFSDGGRALSLAVGDPLSHIDNIRSTLESRPRSSKIALVILEIGGGLTANWRKGVDDVMPVVGPDGYVAVFLKPPNGISLHYVNLVLASSFADMKLEQVMRAKYSIATASPFRAWLKAGVPISFRVGRSRTPTSMVQGALLLSVVLAGGLLTNIYHALIGGKNRGDPINPADEIVTSVTIVYPAGPFEPNQ